LFLLLYPHAIQAQTSSVPPLMNYQGKLTKPDGSPVEDGQYKVRFSIHDALTGGTERWFQTMDPVLVRNGVFSVLLGSGNPLSSEVFSGTRYLEIKVGDFAPLAPRQPIVSVGYSFVAQKAEVATTALTVQNGGVGTGGLADGSVTTAKLANGAVTAAKLADGAVNAAKLSSDPASLAKITSGRLAVTSTHALVTGDLLANNLLLVPTSESVREGKVWTSVFTSSFFGWQESFDTGSVVSRLGEGAWLDSGPNDGATARLGTLNWSPLRASPSTPARFIARWRTNHALAGGKALIRIGVDNLQYPDDTGSPGVGFKVEGPTIMAYCDLGDGSGQRLTAIADNPGPWQRRIGEVVFDGTTLRWYLDGVERHALMVAQGTDLPFGRMSLLSRHAGGRGMALEVSWVAKIGWGD
jgi:hypothetical protein